MVGQGQFLTVVGAAGVGKSRLLFEFRHSLDREKVTVLEGRCQSYGAKTPYFPWLDALRRGLQLRDTDTLNDMHQKVVTNVRTVDPSLEQYLPFYLHLLSIPSMQYPLPAEFQGDELSRLSRKRSGRSISACPEQAAPLLAAGGKRGFGRGLDARCQTQVEESTMAAWFSDAHPMPSMIRSTTWSGRPSTGATCCKARCNDGYRSSLPILQNNMTSPLRRWRSVRIMSIFSAPSHRVTPSPKSSHGSKA